MTEPIAETTAQAEVKQTPLEKELSGLGLLKFSEETAEKQWKIFAREYRIVGVKGSMIFGLINEMKNAIMCGDVEIFEDTSGVCIRQNLRRQPTGAPKSITYKPPGVQHIANRGVDDVPTNQKWTRIAASCACLSEGELTLWLFGRDRSLMETIAQLFINV